MSLLSMKELSAALSRSRWYIQGMKRAGFMMPGRRTTLQAALDWLSSHPDFSASKHFRANSRKSKQRKR